MALPYGTAKAEAKLTIAKRPRKPGFFWILVSATVIAASAGSKPPASTITIDSPRAGIVSIDRNQIRLAGSVAVGNGADVVSEIQIGINDQLIQVPVQENRFEKSSLALQPGQNVICAFLDENTWDCKNVVAPRLAYHFDNDPQAWTVSTTSAVTPIVEQVSQSGNGFLQASTGHEIVEVVFVIDGSGSMATGEKHWEYFIHQFLASLSEEVSGVRAAMLIFREEGFQVEQELFDLQNSLPKDLCTPSGGGDLTENLLPSIKTALTYFGPISHSNCRRQFIAVTDAASSEDSNTFHRELATLANSYHADIHTLVIHQRPLEGTLIYKKDVREAIMKQQEINEAETALALACCQKIAQLNNGVCQKLTVPDRGEFKAQRTELVAKVLSNATAPVPDMRWTLSPPPNEINEMRDAYGENLFVTLRGFAKPKIILHGQSQTVWIELNSNSQEWNTFRIPLNESVEWQVTENTQLDFKELLKTLQRIEIQSRKSDQPLQLDRFLVTQAQQFSTFENIQNQRD